MSTLEGKVAVVTGAASGIGQGVAQVLAERGAAVVVADVNASGAKAVADEITAAGGRAVGIGTDVSSEAAVRAMIEAAVNTYGGLDILHNNAADTSAEVIGRDGDIVDMDVEVWDRTMAVNLRGTMLGCKWAVPAMLARGGGSIINTSSNSALGGEMSRVAYGSSKGGINALTLYVATMHGGKGIRCNAISPGLVMTAAAERNLTAEARDIYRLNHLTPRFGYPADIANVVAFLGSDEASFINGQIWCVDGGMMAHNPTHAQFLALGG